MQHDAFDPWRDRGPKASLRIIRESIEAGLFRFEIHAESAVEDDGLDLADCIRVLEFGAIERERSGINGDPGIEGLRFRVRHRDVVVVVEITERREVVFVTAMRITP